MQALAIHAGPVAMQHIRRYGLAPQHVGAIPAAAGGPKGLMLLRLDQFLFGSWLPQSTQPVHLVGASIGAWRMATACMDDPVAGLQLLEHSYIHGEYATRFVRGKPRLPAPSAVSAEFARNLQMFYGGRVAALLQHPRYRLHVITSHGRHLLAREQALRTALGYLGAYATNVARRKALGHWIERVVFSGTQGGSGMAALPFDTGDFRTRQVALTPQNFMLALQASGSIPFVLQAVHDIPGAARGAYWDGGITDYHLHLRYLQGNSHVQPAPDGTGALVLYPHFQQAVVPGWLDKALPWRHASTPALERMVVIAPRPEWVRTLPNAKLPDRTDFQRYILDQGRRKQVWTRAVAASQQLADEFAQWLEKPDVAMVQPL